MAGNKQEKVPICNTCAADVGLSLCLHISTCWSVTVWTSETTEESGLYQLIQNPGNTSHKQTQLRFWWLSFVFVDTCLRDTFHLFGCFSLCTHWPQRTTKGICCLDTASSLSVLKYSHRIIKTWELWYHFVNIQGAVFDWKTKLSFTNLNFSNSIHHC